MGSNATKATKNVYYQCRQNAAKYNERLKSREGAAELLDISLSSITDYELGITTPPAYMILRMADLYNAPELKHHYCRHECLLGAYCVPDVEGCGIDRATLKLLGALQHGSEVKDVLLNITEDGEITEDEVPKLRSVVAFLDKLADAGAELKVLLAKIQNAPEQEGQSEGDERVWQ